jgi:hypothetical protein
MLKDILRLKITVLLNIGATRFSATAIAIRPTITSCYVADYWNVHGDCNEPFLISCGLRMSKIVMLDVFEPKREVVIDDWNNAGRKVIQKS